MIKIAVAGGVTGGHLYPALAVLKELEKLTPIDVLYFTVSGKLEEKVLKDYNYKTVSLKIQGLKRPIYSVENIKRLLKIFKANNLVLRELKKFKPDIVFVTGGYVSYPVGIATKKLKIPLFIQEQNVIPGLANIKLSSFAKKVFVAFEESKKYFQRDVVVSGNPILICHKENLNFEKKTILIVGGSGGSEFLNSLACKLSNKLKDYHFILSSGRKEVPCKSENLTILDYIENMSDYYSAVSCAITRGGATTVSELIFFDTPSIIIPWEGSTEAHQIENAKQIEKLGLGYVIREKEVNIDEIANKIIELSNRERKGSPKTNPAILIAKEIKNEVLK
jgi:UDP-N-acetylglucosamine--N-acetylmuramyl-(pentapeptide) pyrophosphoryl-undecaprenol N-acetylglucosamine transferase